MPFKFTVSENPLTIEFEVNDLAEGVAVLTDGRSALGKAFDAARSSFHDDAPAAPAPAPDADPLAAVRANPDWRDLTAKELKEVARNIGFTGGVKADAIAAIESALGTAEPAPAAPVTVEAPAPIAPPAAPGAAPDDLTIPPVLDRSQNPVPPSPAPAPAPAAAPPPPAAPAAPAPAAPPAMDARRAALIDELKNRATNSADGGAALVAWLVQSGVVIDGSSFDQAISVLEFVNADQVDMLANALQIPA